MKEILDRILLGKGFKYLVKWEGYLYSKNTWEIIKNLNYPKKLEEFY